MPSDRAVLFFYLGRGTVGFLWVYLAYALLSFGLRKITKKRVSLWLRMAISVFLCNLIFSGSDDFGLGWLQWIIDGVLVYLFIIWRKKDEWYLGDNKRVNMNCPSCSKGIAEESKFCRFCGKDLRGVGGEGEHSQKKEKDNGPKNPSIIHYAIGIIIIFCILYMTFLFSFK